MGTVSHDLSREPHEKNLLLRNQKADDLYSNGDLGLTLTYFTARSNLVPYAFVWEKGKTKDFSETIVGLI